jgi:sulfur-oxidizing protein SoxX
MAASLAAPVVTPLVAPTGPVAFDAATAGVTRPLTDAPGDPVRGRAIVASRHSGLCLLCHRAPTPEAPLQGDIASDLAGAGSRWTAAQLRARIVDPKRLDPRTVMPAYFRSTDGLSRVAPAWAGRTMLDAQQVEDVVAYLVTLK